MTSTLEPGTTAEAQGRPEARGRRDFLATRRRTAVVELTMTVLTVAVAVLIAFLVVLASGKDATGALNALLTGPLERTPRIGRWLADATTLALLGLSVSIPFRARQISLGAEGQVYVGALASALVAIHLHLPPVAAVLVPLAVAALAGGALGAVPGVMKARLGANEIVATLMLNAVVVRVFDYLLTDHIKAPDSSAVQSAPVRPDSALPLLSDFFGVPWTGRTSACSGCSRSPRPCGSCWPGHRSATASGSPAPTRTSPGTAASTYRAPSSGASSSAAPSPVSRGPISPSASTAGSSPTWPAAWPSRASSSPCWAATTRSVWSPPRSSTRICASAAM
ncbi:hypothetical protein H4687_008122 [Streptomyces stelliscabiei]|uniref:ABC transporter permease n=1 Tax=Streptomyces stelliscabiei TaxID=146820 RepID=A0A8I0P9H5_9ACTN|nr:hypothetical protein [Streptomyces stelliscabiei]